MRSLLLFAALAVAACGPDDDGRGTATAVTTATTATTATTSGDASTTGVTGGVATSTTTTTGVTTGVTTAVTTTDAATDSTSTTGAATSTTAVASTTTTGASTTTGGDVVSCPPEGPVDCSPGPGNGEGCIFTTTCFRTAVQNAIKQVLAEHPEWFMHDDMGDYVLEVELYMDTVVELVGAGGLCSIRDPNAGDEIVVKHNNDYAENFDILTAAVYVRYGDGIYTSTCIPAWF